MSEDSNRVLAKIVLTIILFVVIAGGIGVIANDQADGFAVVLIIVVMIVAAFYLGRAIIER